jgi:nucleoside-diphosphate-sugar epimerase
MRIYVAGATGALGRQLVPRLVASGHEVVGQTRSNGGRERIRALGARPIVADALDAEAVVRAVAETVPDVIVHQLTALAGELTGRSYERMLAATNRLRIEGTAHLLAAAQAAGVGRFIAQSFAGTGLPYERKGAWVKTEDDPIDPTPVASMRSTIGAIRHLEESVVGAPWTQGIVLRYGSFYGPGTSMTRGGEHFELIRRRRLPLVGSAAGVWSFIHIEDAAEATIAAIERGRRGIYNIVDDEPAPVSAWLPAAAAALGAPPPRHVPRWLARILAGAPAVTIMTEGRGSSNARAKRDLDWRPAHSSWRTGFVEAVQ